MGITEIILIIAGVIVLALGYLLPARKKDMDEEVLLISEDEVRKMVDREVEGAKSHIADIIDESVTYAIEKTERSMERVANEKIMAINEYSDTVLEEINKNHKEVLFLYDMLNDKHDNLKTTIAEAAGTAEEVKQAVRDVEISAQELQESVKRAELTAKEAQDTAENAVEEVKAYSGALQDEVRHYAESLQNGLTDGLYEQENEEDSDRQMPEENESLFYDVNDFREQEEDAFMPITPPRVEIIHDVDGDYVAAPPQLEEQMQSSRFDRAERLAREDRLDRAERLAREDRLDRAERLAREDRLEREERLARANRLDRAERLAREDELDRAERLAREDRLDRTERLEREEGFAREDRLDRVERVGRSDRTGRQTDKKPVNIQFTNGRDSSRNSNERILELHKAGKSNMAIAKELGLGIGEVKLVIDLFEGM